jgi:5-aminolevulinate synthase
MERLRITPLPYHDDGLIDALAEALIDVWDRLALPRKDGGSPRVTFAKD